MSTILIKIASLQSNSGLFPAYRTNRIIGYQRPDTTLFFTAITVFTLQKIKHLVDSESQQTIDQIAAKAQAIYPQFQNKDGLKTYNFWKTCPSKHFPNGYIFKHFDHFRIPDDVDDTAFVYLTTNPKAEELGWIKHKLAIHANLSKQKIKNTYPEYQQLRAYSTWFGKNMYVEFDVCVLSNVLYMVYEYELPHNQHDDDSMAYIRSVVETGRYLSVPFRVAHQYPKTSLIMYHVARLMAAFNPIALDSIKDKLIADIQQLMLKNNSPMERLILATSLLRFGIKSDFDVNEISENDIKTSPFFIAGLLTAYEHKLLYKIASQPIFHIHWHCEAHNLALMAEFEALNRNFSAPL